MSRVLVAMSGGVDSSVAAALLAEAGHEVVGVTMKTFCYTETPAHGKTCCGLDGITDAKRVAAHLGIPHYVFDVEEDFTRDVIDDFVDEYARGRTPNPCVRCNSNTKFRDLLARGRALDCDRIATGHYVRVEHPDLDAGPGGAGSAGSWRGEHRHLDAGRLGSDSGRRVRGDYPDLEAGPPGSDSGRRTPASGARSLRGVSRVPGSALLRGIDHAKDQAYFLWGLPADLIPRLLFPVGALTKDEVRARARTLGLVTADKPESQEICFVPTGDYRDLLQKRLGPTHPGLEPGPIVRRDDQVIGEHTGYAGFTVGQRRGLGGGFEEPLFVLEIRPERREVVVGTRDELYADHVEVGGLNWLLERPAVGDRYRVQLRYRAPAVPCVVEEIDERSLTLQLAEPQRAVTPGQSAVVFEGERVVGGGRIARTGVAAVSR